MSSSDGKPATAAVGIATAIGIGVGALILGAAMGSVMHAKLAANPPNPAGKLAGTGNNITLFVNPDGKVSLEPQAGDTIQWTAAKGSTLAITFTGNGKPPCQTYTASTSTCTGYQPASNGPSLLLYGCTMVPPPPLAGVIPCYDPGIGFASPTAPPSGTPLIVVDRAAHAAAKPAGAPPNSKPAAPPAGPNTASTNPPARVIELVALCVGRVPTIFEGGGTNPILSVTVEPNDTITWNPYGLGYTIPDLSSICLNAQTDPINSGTNQSCHINPAATAGYTDYTLTMACDPSTGTPQQTMETIVVETPTTVAVGKHPVKN